MILWYLVCTEGFYGPNCTQKCGHCRNESVCNNITGDCLQGCDEHWGGSKCDGTLRNIDIFTFKSSTVVGVFP